jgi:hypothetical protein
MQTGDFLIEEKETEETITEINVTFQRTSTENVLLRDLRQKHKKHAISHLTREVEVRFLSLGVISTRKRVRQRGQSNIW